MTKGGRLPMNLPLESTRLILRTFEERDIRTFSAYRSDPEVARYQGWEAPYSLEQAAQFVADMRTRIPGDPGQWYQLALELKGSKAMIGDCAFHLANNGLQAEIGMTLAPAYQGQGYGREAVGCLLDTLFSQLKLHRVYANVDPQNKASIRMLDKLGFRFEGHFLQSMWLKGEWVDEDWYALLREEWLAAQTS
jgi:RimJ/RimL family protein N-acetyltransferase